MIHKPDLHGAPHVDERPGVTRNASYEMRRGKQTVCRIGVYGGLLGMKLNCTTDLRDCRCFWHGEAFANSREALSCRGKLLPQALFDSRR